MWNYGFLKIKVFVLEKTSDSGYGKVKNSKII